MNTRTDVHALSSVHFDPQAYRFVGCWVNGNARLNDNVKEKLEELGNLGYRLGNGSAYQCGHCGARLKYSAVLVRDDFRQYIHVGETCLDNRFTALTRAEFQRLRKTEKLNRERERLADKRDAYLSKHPEFKNLSESDNYTLQDLWRSMMRFGSLTEKQEALARKIIDQTAKRAERQAQWEAEKQAKIVAGVRAKSGKVSVQGSVTSVKYDDTWGQWKMRVVTDEGWSVWSTIPAAIVDGVLDETDTLIPDTTVRFTAMLRVCDDDPTFAFASRPNRASVISETPTKVKIATLSESEEE